MNDQLARSLFMDYLYDEISESDKTKLEAYLDNNPDSRKELEQLKQTRSLLQQMPEPDPAQQLLVMEPHERSFSQWWTQAKNLLPHSLLGKTAFAAAAGLILFFLLGSLAQLHIDTSNEGLAISLGYSPTVNQGLSQEEANALIAQIKEENTAMLADYAEAINRQNEEQLQQVIAYFEEQRMQDLQLVNQTLNQLQENTNYRINRTNEYLGQVLQTVSYQNEN
jgi:ferric-dicitrate binding protein FerR (iron transport regulator)